MRTPNHIVKKTKFGATFFSRKTGAKRVDGQVGPKNFLLDTLGDEKQNGLIVSYQEKYGYSYAQYSSVGDFCESLNEVPDDERFFHEILVGRTHTYADLEWAPLSALNKDKVMNDFVLLFDDIMTNSFNDAICQGTYVFTDCSRAEKGSLHFIFRSELFCWSSAKEQETFWRYFCHRARELSDIYPNLTYFQETDSGLIENKSVIDIGVYRKDAPIRTVLSAKREVGIPLTVYSVNFNEPPEEFSIANCIVTVDDNELEPYEVPGSELSIANRDLKVPSVARGDLLEIIQALVPGTTIKEIRGKLIILSNDGERPCLVTEGKTHDSNGSYCTFNDRGIWFGCLHPNCKPKGKKQIHEFARDENELDFEWLVKNFNRSDEGMSDIYCKFEKNIVLIENDHCFAWSDKTSLWEKRRDSNFMTNNISVILEDLLDKVYKDYVLPSMTTVVPVDKYLVDKAEFDTAQEQLYQASIDAESDRRRQMAAYRAAIAADPDSKPVKPSVTRVPRHKKLKFRKRFKNELTNEQKLENVHTDWGKMRMYILSQRGSSSIRAKSVGKLADFKFESKFDADPDVLPITGGLLVDLKTGNTRPRTRDDFYSHFCPVSIETDATKVDHIRKIMLEICDQRDLYDYLQVFLGYCMTGRIDERIFTIWHGVGANGKSLIMALMRDVLGTYCATVSKKTMMKGYESSSSNSATLDLKQIIPSRVVFMSESEDGAALDTTFVKGVSGGDPIKSRGNYEDFQDFAPKFKMVMASNYVPNFDASDVAMVDRVRCFPFKSRFSENPVDGEKLINKELLRELQSGYLDAFFTWLLEGANAWYRSGLPNPPADMRKETEDVIKENDPVASFIKDCLSFEEDSQTTLANIYQKYKEYCRASGFEPVAARSLSTALKKKKLESKHSKTGVVFKHYVIREQNA